MTQFSVSIVMPVFNEEDNIHKAVSANIEVLSKAGVDYEIIIVNDGSTDSTRAILEKSFNNFGDVQICHLQENTGYGGAVKRGIALVKKDWIICVPADSPLDTDTYAAFEEHIGNADILVSFRVQRVGYSWWMLLNSYAYHKIISLLFGIRLKDYNWMHAYRHQIFRQGKIEIEFSGIFMLAEVLIKAHRSGLRIIEFPVVQKQRISGVASAGRLINIIKTVRDLLKFRLRTN